VLNYSGIENFEDVFAAFLCHTMAEVLGSAQDSGVETEVRWWLGKFVSIYLKLKKCLLQESNDSVMSSSSVENLNGLQEEPQLPPQPSPESDSGPPEPNPNSAVGSSG